MSKKVIKNFIILSLIFILFQSKCSILELDENQLEELIKNHNILIRYCDKDSK